MMAITQRNQEQALQIIQTRSLYVELSGAGGTAMHMACYHGLDEVVRALIEVGSSLAAQDEFGNRPLHLAATRDQLSICEILVAYEAGLNSQNVDGWQPLHKAAFNGHIDICQLLIQKGAELNCEANGGETPLDIAFNSIYPETKAVLYKLGCRSTKLA